MTTTNILSPGSFMTDILGPAEAFAPGSLEWLASLNSQNRIAGVNDITASGGMRK